VRRLDVAEQFIHDAMRDDAVLDLEFLDGTSLPAARLRNRFDFLANAFAASTALFLTVATCRNRSLSARRNCARCSPSRRIRRSNCSDPRHRHRDLGRLGDHVLFQDAVLALAANAAAMAFSPNHHWRDSRLARDRSLKDERPRPCADADADRKFWCVIVLIC